ncbi:FeoB-associated Cys-rich membrane protein [Thermoanaerobacterium thermosaccharolyticum]|jgi:ferrous iron transport protein B|uniref:FeoB-associated Cys-rich membrane protein n=1 Tax=Thermoanaerobacterium thermosaccharolyticum TaxID=1517 RepID=UPI00123C0C2F|nr:FeoB-associated Cys-rich membrane protein [Thermoanaerobacterium thermosaccharolyticum]KAA5806355.1 FeoB-associated Cys-rich membrane protein [Thermoanaerobacterium thermosaccharolyticum]MBE0069990.1 FeoB-associated Cys-rich membrane protein [Thermoanaerobacterium thermosaccharolyticum]MBE0229544.1 FeoB-associated Cys-rich membrane protein [Thermoanaerobacterium thermosaccharolyticum]
MVVEIIITSAIVALAVFILYKNIKKSTSGQCNCGSCSSSCPKFSAIKQKK